MGKIGTVLDSVQIETITIDFHRIRDKTITTNRCYANSGKNECETLGDSSRDHQ